MGKAKSVGGLVRMSIFAICTLAGCAPRDQVVPMPYKPTQAATPSPPQQTPAHLVEPLAAARVGVSGTYALMCTAERIRNGDFRVEIDPQRQAATVTTFGIGNDLPANFRLTTNDRAYRMERWLASSAEIAVLVIDRATGRGGLASLLPNGAIGPNPVLINCRIAGPRL